MDRSLGDLKPATRWVARPLEVHDSLDSTNLLAEERARAGAPEGTVILADRQTAGRGRLGRSFFSPGGRSIYLSLLLRPPCPPEELHRHVFCAAIAVAETAEARLPAGTAIEIKWPNDVLLAGRKTSGINLPAQVEAGRVEWAVLGIGLNVNTALEEFPDELRDIATSLRIAGGVRVDRVACAEELLGRLEQEIERLRAEGFARVLDRWQNFFRMQGDFVRVGGPGVARALEGEVCGVDPEGALLVQTEAGTERVLAGDVTLLARRKREEA